jgi:hypothetical protein
MIWVGWGMALFGASALAIIALCMVDEAEDCRNEAAWWKACVG